MCVRVRDSSLRVSVCVPVSVCLCVSLCACVCMCVPFFHPYLAVAEEAVKIPVLEDLSQALRHLNDGLGLDQSLETSVFVSVSVCVCVVCVCVSSCACV